MAVHTANQINAIREWKVEQEDLLKAFTDRESAKGFESGTAKCTSNAYSRPLSQRLERLLSRRQEAVGNLNAGVLGVPDPLGNQVPFSRLSLEYPAH